MKINSVGLKNLKFTCYINCILQFIIVNDFNLTYSLFNLGFFNFDLFSKISKIFFPISEF